MKGEILSVRNSPGALSLFLDEDQRTALVRTRVGARFSMCRSLTTIQAASTCQFQWLMSLSFNSLLQRPLPAYPINTAGASLCKRRH